MLRPRTHLFCQCLAGAVEEEPGLEAGQSRPSSVIYLQTLGIYSAHPERRGEGVLHSGRHRWTMIVLHPQEMRQAPGKR